MVHDLEREASANVTRQRGSAADCGPLSEPEYYWRATITLTLSLTLARGVRLSSPH